MPKQTLARPRTIVKKKSPTPPPLPPPAPAQTGFSVIPIVAIMLGLTALGLVTAFIFLYAVPGRSTPGNSAAMTVEEGDAINDLTNEVDDRALYTSATYRVSIEYPSSYVITQQDDSQLLLASSQPCAKYLRLPTTAIATECVYPSLTIARTKITVRGTAATTTITMNGLQWEKTVDESTPNSSVLVYQAQKDGVWYIVQAQYAQAAGDGVDLIVSSLANSLTFAEKATTNAAAQSASPSADWQQYTIDTTAETFMKTDTGKTLRLATPFPLNDYHGQTTPWGALFWKKGPSKTATIKGFDQPMEYEGPIDPVFQFYDFSTGTFSQPPAVTFTKGSQVFQQVFSIIPSSTEKKLLIEIGTFDTASDEFVPGLGGPEPVKTIGKVYDLETNTFESGDPLTAAKNITSFPLFSGATWDSQHKMVVLAPGGEGCGRYDTLTFIDLATKRKTIAGGAKSFDFAESVCNPKNTVSPDGRWFVLYGTNTKQRSSAYLFTAEHGSTPVKQTSVSATLANSWVKTWNTTGRLPTITFDTGTTIDFQ